MAPELMERRQEAAKKANKHRKQLQLIDYRVEGEDILILSGQYHGKKVSEVFVLGPRERDYIVEHIWMRNDPEAVRIINALFKNS